MYNNSLKVVCVKAFLSLWRRMSCKKEKEIMAFIIHFYFLYANKIIFTERLKQVHPLKNKGENRFIGK